MRWAVSAAVFGHEPAAFDRDPRQRQRPQCQPQEPAFFLEVVLACRPECDGKERDEMDADGRHDAEGPEQRQHARHGVHRGLGNLRRRGIADIVALALQQQAVAQIRPMRIEDHARLGIVLLGANTLQCAVGDLAAADAVFGTADQFGNCRDRLIQRTRSDQSYQVRNLDGVIVAMGYGSGCRTQ